MKRIVLTFGLISGGIMSALMLMLLPFESSVGEQGYLIGYTTMVLAFLLTYFGIRSYRDNAAGGQVGFWRALMVGTLIVGVASVCYTATWEGIYFGMKPDFTTKYIARQLDAAKASGMNQADLAKKTAELQHFAVMYENPAYNAALTILEPLPVGLLLALVSAGICSRKRRSDDGSETVQLEPSPS